MNRKTYRNIIRKRGLDPLEKTHERCDAFSRAKLSFIQDLARGKVVWTNKLGRDFFCYLSNNHPLMSIFFAPICHPYSRQDRIVVLMCATAFAVMYASGSSAVGKDNAALGYSMAVAGGISNAIFNKILRILGTCSCVQHYNPVFRKCCEFFGHCAMCLWAMISFYAFIIGVILAAMASNIGKFFLSFIISLFSGWIFSFISLFLLFMWTWRREQNIYTLQKNPFVISCFDYAEYQQNVPFTRKIIPGLNEEEHQQIATHCEKQNQMPPQNNTFYGNSQHLDINPASYAIPMEQVQLQTQPDNIPAYLAHDFNANMQTQQQPIYQIQQQSSTVPLHTQPIQIANTGNIQPPVPIIQVNLPSVLNQLNNNNQNIIVQQQQQLPQMQVQQQPIIVVQANNPTIIPAQNPAFIAPSANYNKDGNIYSYANSTATKASSSIAKPKRSVPQQPRYMYVPKNSDYNV